MKLAIVALFLGVVACAYSDQGWGWQPPSKGLSFSFGNGGWNAWKPTFKYLNFAIPIPQLPRIRFGLGGHIKAHAQILPNKGWGWSG